MNFHMDPMEATDLDFLRGLRSNPLVTARLFRSVESISLAEQKKWYKRVKADAKHRVWIASVDLLRVGYAQLYKASLLDYSMELSVVVDPKAQGQRIGTDIVRWLLDYAFNVGVPLNALIARVFTDNEAALALFEKCGFQELVEIPEAILKDGAYRDIKVLIYRGKDYDRDHCAGAGEDGD